MKYLFVLLFSFPAFAGVQINDWKETKAAKETDVVALAKEALDKNLGSFEDGRGCGVRSINNLDRESGGDEKSFTVSGFVRAPYVGCTGSRLYHCRLAYNAAEGEKVRLTSTECDPASGGSED